jgi:hypothetical protein
MARKVYFHIGAPKTGTTYLQDILWANRKRLAQQGVLVPGDTRMDAFFATLSVRVAQGLANRPVADRTAWSRIVDAVQAWDGTAVISHEFFGAATREQAKDALAALEPAEIHLVFTARDYVAQFPALWQESVKMRATRGFSQFTKAALDDDLDELWGWKTTDVVAILDRWGDDVPPDRVHVVTVPQRGGPPTLLWERFSGLIGIQPGSCVLGDSRANESLGVAQVRLLEAVKSRLPDELKPLPERYRWLRAFFSHQILASQKGERFGLRPDEAARMRERTVRVIQHLERAGYDVVGDLAELLGPDPSPPLRHPDDVTDAEVLDAALDAIVALLVAARRRERRLEARSRREPRPRSLLAAARASDAPSVRLARRAVDRTRRLRANRRES